MKEKKSTYRVEIKNIGTPPNETFGWNIYRNRDVLPILRSQQLFVSRAAGLADANRSRLQTLTQQNRSARNRAKTPRGRLAAVCLLPFLERQILRSFQRHVAANDGANPHPRMCA
jgi:hypothetical protein